VWWLVAAVVLALAVAIGWLIRTRARRTAWTRELSAAVDEAVWFARVLLPQLGHAPSVEQMAGGWQVAAPRIVALETRLSRLESTARNEEDRARARTLREAVESARLRISALPSLPNRFAAGEAMARSAAELESAMATIGPGAQSSSATR
jgi:hypothetical protein